MGKMKSLITRGLRFVRQYGALQLYRKIRERNHRNQLEKGYSAWLLSVMPKEEELKSQAERKFQEVPLFSVVVPCYETPEPFLREMIESVLQQSYGRLELCLADGSTGNQVERVAREYESADKRVIYKKLEENKGIAGNTNEALKMAGGDFIGLLDHDDVLAKHALYEMAAALEADSELDILYTDEDKLTFDSREHFQPHFKPDFNLELLRTNNYICHFFVARRSIVEKTGGFSADYDGAQDHDFIFRCVEQTDAICHIPKILYHWRCHNSSTASNPESKLYAYEAGRRAVLAHLERQGIRASVEATENYGFYRVRYQTPEKGRVTIVKPDLRKLKEKGHGQNSQNTVYYDRACNSFVIIAEQLKREARSEYLLFLTEKAEIPSEAAVSELLSCAAQKETGMVCMRLYDRKKRLRAAGDMEGVADPFGEAADGLREGYTGYFHRVVLQQEIKEVKNGCFLIRKDLFLEAAGETAAEICREIRNRGLKIIYNPWVVLYENER